MVVFERLGSNGAPIAPKESTEELRLPEESWSEFQERLKAGNLPLFVRGRIGIIDKKYSDFLAKDKIALTIGLWAAAEGLTGDWQQKIATALGFEKKDVSRYIDYGSEMREQEITDLVNSRSLRIQSKKSKKR